MDKKIKKNEIDQILIKVMDYDLPKLSEERLAIISTLVYKFMIDYEYALNIERPSTANSDVNIFVWEGNSRQILIKILDILYEPLKCQS